MIVVNKRKYPADRWFAARRQTRYVSAPIDEASVNSMDNITGLEAARAEKAYQLCLAAAKRNRPRRVDQWSRRIICVEQGAPKP